MRRFQIARWRVMNATKGAIIYCTTDGTAPAGSTKYAGPIALPATETIRALAGAPG